jgi:phytoene desaturase
VPHTVVIGAGFAGLAAACHLARGGARVTVVERHDQAGGRARTWSQDGFLFDMGPSWYWMPDLFERFFRTFGHEVEGLYDLRRLDPSYRVVWGDGGAATALPPGPDPASPSMAPVAPEAPAWDIPAGLPALRELFEGVEPGAGAQLDRFIAETKYIYEAAFSDYLFRPSLSFLEFVDPRLVLELSRMRMLRSMATYARSFFRNERLTRLVEWPVLFLGAPAHRTSAMYGLMGYADMALGTWYPMGGMHRIIAAMVRVAEELDVEFRFDTPVDRILVEEGRAVGVRTASGETIRADAVLASAAYHHVEQVLLDPPHRQYSPRYWEGRVMSPSSLLYYLGIDGDLGALPHHTLFFDRDLGAHMDAVYAHPSWPREPLFYACAPSVTDPSVAPEGCSNVFLLIPLAPGLEDSDAAREKVFQGVMERLEAHVGRPLRERLRVKRSYAMRDFEADYGAFKGNAYGMANTLLQTGPLKPKLRSTKVQGLYFAGQLTVPGPGMPPSLVSGELAARVLLEELGEPGVAPRSGPGG